MYHSTLIRGWFCVWPPKIPPKGAQWEPSLRPELQSSICYFHLASCWTFCHYWLFRSARGIISKSIWPITLLFVTNRPQESGPHLPHIVEGECSFWLFIFFIPQIYLVLKQNWPNVCVCVPILTDCNRLLLLLITWKHFQFCSSSTFMWFIRSDLGTFSAILPLSGTSQTVPRHKGISKMSQSFPGRKCSEEIPSLTLTESQTGWGWKGPLEVIWSNAPGPAEPLRVGCPELGPDGFWISQRMGIHHLSGQPVPVLSHPHSEKTFPDVHREPPVFQFVPTASGLVTQRHWKRLAPTYFHPPFRYFYTLMRSTLFSKFVFFCWVFWCRKTFPSKQVSSSSWLDTNKTAHAHLPEPQHLRRRFPLPCRHLWSAGDAYRWGDSSTRPARCWTTALLLPGLKGSLQNTHLDITVILGSLKYCANKLSLSCRGRFIKRVMALIWNCVADPSVSYPRVPQGFRNKPAYLSASEMLGFYQYCLCRRTPLPLVSEQHKELEHDMISAKHFVAGFPHVTHHG